MANFIPNIGNAVGNAFGNYFERAIAGAGRGAAEAVHIVGPATREEIFLSIRQWLFALAPDTRTNNNETLKSGLCERIISYVVNNKNINSNNNLQLDDASKQQLSLCINHALNKCEVLSDVRQSESFELIAYKITKAINKIIHLVQGVIPGVVRNGVGWNIDLARTVNLQQTINEACKKAMVRIHGKAITVTPINLLNKKASEIKTLLRAGTELGQEWKITTAIREMKKYRQESLVNADITGTKFHWRNFRAIHWAAVRGNFPAIDLLSKVDGLDIDARNHYGSTAIMSVLWKRDDAVQTSKIIDALLKLGANPNKANTDGDLSLLRALTRFKDNSLPIVRVLLQQVPGQIAVTKKHKELALELATTLKLNASIKALLR